MLALIGIDCATQPNKVGLALGELDGERVRIKTCRTASPKERPECIVAGWIKQSERALLALDAPRLADRPRSLRKNRLDGRAVPF